MMSSPRQRLGAVTVLALVMIGSASSAFAIRNRYTNEQSDGFPALFLDAFGQPGFADDEPVYRPHRRPPHGRVYHRDENQDDDPFGF